MDTVHQPLQLVAYVSRLAMVGHEQIESDNLFKLTSAVVAGLTGRKRKPLRANPLAKAFSRRDVIFAFGGSRSAKITHGMSGGETS
ncbi:hypothetical protein QP178_04770 [Sphingomonas aurantiaca]|uniref:hypothetical protein n=1 Tax=Sphingomonas aurantiaca TaxID=185949 RepID=UPI002FE336BB